MRPVLPWLAILDEKVRERLRKIAPEVVFECVGKPGGMMRAMEIVAPRGTVVGMGACNEPEPIVANLGLMKELRIRFALTYDRLLAGTTIGAKVSFSPNAFRQVFSTPSSSRQTETFTSTQFVDTTKRFEDEAASVPRRYVMMRSIIDCASFGSNWNRAIANDEILVPRFD